MQTLPLEGVRVVDISNFLAGPGATMFLADFGAEVIKCERGPEGDEFRRWGYDKNGVGLYFKMVNRNKKSVTADLRTPLGVEIVKRLVKNADVIVENYRPGTIEKWGLGYDVLSAINPRIVLLRISGYGQNGPNSKKPGYGTSLEAYSGLVYVNGHPDRAPLLTAFATGDVTTAMMGAFLTLVALRERERSGQGQVIDLALYEPLLTLLGPIMLDYDQLGIVQQRDGSHLPWVAPRNVFTARDGKYVVVSAGSQDVFTRLCSALEIPEIAEDPRFLTNRDRMQHREELDEIMQRAIERFDLDDLVSRIESAHAVVAPVRSIAEIIEDPHILARDGVITAQDADLGPLRMQNVVGTLSRTPGKVRWTAPRCGEHDKEILQDELGFTEAELQQSSALVRQ